MAVLDDFNVQNIVTRNLQNQLRRRWPENFFNVEFNYSVESERYYIVVEVDGKSKIHGQSCRAITFDYSLDNTTMAALTLLLG